MKVKKNKYKHASAAGFAISDASKFCSRLELPQNSSDFDHRRISARAAVHVAVVGVLVFPELLRSILLGLPPVQLLLTLGVLIDTYQFYEQLHSCVIIMPVLVASL